MSTASRIWPLFDTVPNLVLVVAPFALLPMIIGDEVTPESKCAYLVYLMAILWTFNPIPLAITSLLPIVLLPLLNLASTEVVCSAYLRGSNMLFFGCLALALAIEKSNLHQRIALRVLLGVRTEFTRILLGFMLTTMFFSMWIVSTATVALMLPIADEIFKNLFNMTLEGHAERETRSRRASSIILSGKEELFNFTTRSERWSLSKNNSISDNGKFGCFLCVKIL